MLRKAAHLFLSRLRLSNPWRFKAPFLISIPYQMLFLGGIPPEDAALGFGMSCATIFGIAGFGYFLNDWTDREEDQRAGKFNVMLQLHWAAVVGLLLLFLALAVVPWVVYFPKGWSTLGLLGFEFLLFVLYSAPPFRFKERGWLGVLCDAGYAHAVPAVLAGITFFYLGNRSFVAIFWFLGLLGAWQAAVGVRNILLQAQQLINLVRTVCRMAYNISRPIPGNSHPHCIIHRVHLLPLLDTHGNNRCTFRLSVVSAHTGTILDLRAIQCIAIGNKHSHDKRSVSDMRWAVIRSRRSNALARKLRQRWM